MNLYLFVFAMARFKDERGGCWKVAETVIVANVGLQHESLGSRRRSRVLAGAGALMLC